MRIEEKLTYPATPVAVAAMLADRGFVVSRCEAMQSTEVEVEVTGTADGAFTVTTTRVQSTAEVPENLRRFAGTGLRVRQVDTWPAPTTGGARVGTATVEVLGLPVRFTGSVALEPTPEGCVQTVEGELTAAIPLMGGQVERAVAPAVVGAMHTEQRLGTAWLTEHPAP